MKYIIEILMPIPTLVAIALTLFLLICRLFLWIEISWLIVFGPVGIIAFAWFIVLIWWMVL